MFNTCFIMGEILIPRLCLNVFFGIVRMCIALGKGCSLLLPLKDSVIASSRLFLIKTSVGKVLHNNRSYQAASQSGGMSEGHPIHCN